MFSSKNSKTYLIVSLKYIRTILKCCTYLLMFCCRAYCRPFVVELFRDSKILTPNLFSPRLQLLVEKAREAGR